MSNEDGKVNSEKSSASKLESESDRKKQLVSQKIEILRFKNPPESRLTRGRKEKGQDQTTQLKSLMMIQMMSTMSIG